MQGTTPSPDPSKSTGSGAPRGLDATASAVSAQRAEANAASALEAEKSQDAQMRLHGVMGEYEDEGRFCEELGFCIACIHY